MLSAGLSPVEDRSGISEAREEVGFGLEWFDEGGTSWRLGRREWVRGGPTNNDGPAADVSFGHGGTVMAEFSVAEAVREDAAVEVARLRKLKLDVFILSGDRSEKVVRMADRLGLPAESIASEKTPSDKAAWIRELDRKDTLMIGDGANDSMAFAAAHCRGTPAIDRGLLEHQSDFFFLGRGLAGVRRLFEMVRSRQQAIVTVLSFTTLYNLVVVAVALAGLMSPLLAAVLMPASAVISLGLAGISMRSA
jgi:Cu2+-exporting ATPase